MDQFDQLNLLNQAQTKIDHAATILRGLGLQADADKLIKLGNGLDQHIEDIWNKMRETLGRPEIPNIV